MPAMKDHIMTTERLADSRPDDAEWDAWVKMAAAYRLVKYYGSCVFMPNVVGFASYRQ
jgi:hypothetical protein